MIIRDAEMPTKARIRRKFQVTIPEEVRKAYPLVEGQFVKVAATPEGILITPVLEMDADQAWFWSPEWAAQERRANDDFVAHRVTEAASGDEAIARLRGSRKSKRPR